MTIRPTSLLTTLQLLLIACISLLSIQVVHSQVDSDGELIYSFDFLQECEDNHADCEQWAIHGECFGNLRFMQNECRKSCGFCEVLADTSGRTTRAQALYRGSDMGIGQRVDPTIDGTTEQDIQYILTKGRNYMKFVAMESFSEEVIARCKNKHANCAVWAALGQCQVPEHQEWMLPNCGPVCGSCDVVERSMM
eukprot:Nitzschia sp. Nitz4//scaffold146_size56529//19882//20542//NITZ4_006574-RA/size56529-exonerate_est2genome-gene-0.34-mRNA-1//-1//CDS//3329536629//1897//frame0